MPEISRFYGIVIQMYFDDQPPPHFHAIYAGHKAVFATLVIYTLDFSDYPGENSKNGLMLYLLVFLGATVFLYPSFKLISINWMEKKVLPLWEAIIQVLPSIGLLLVFLNHAK